MKIGTLVRHRTMLKSNFGYGIVMEVKGRFGKNAALVHWISRRRRPVWINHFELEVLSECR